MPKAKFDSKVESTQFELLPDADYPFEVIGVDFEISKGAKTGGSDTMELKCRFYKDATFTRPVAQWTESLIFHPSCEWKISVFTKAANMLVNGAPPADGADIEYTEETVLGLRGWATVRAKDSTKDPGKQWNYVAAWITSKEKLPRAAVKPTAQAPAEAGEKLPF